VAVADADEKGLAAAVKRLGHARGYRDYRQMLDEAKPELVSICPRWIDQHQAMVVAAAERGVRGIYLEKPLCPTLAEADAMIAVCEKQGVKVAQSFQTRYSPKLPVIDALLRSGAIGKVLEYRARGKEDHRGGGEDLWVLGPHMFNLIHHFAGPPQWCFAAVEQGGRPIRQEDVRPGAEGIGPLAGDEVHAVYRMENAAVAHFDSVRGAGGRPSRFGLTLCGTAGMIQIFNPGLLPDVFLLDDPAWSPGLTGKKWVPVSSAGLGQPEPLEDRKLPGGNLLAVRDLIEAVRQDRQPLASIYDARLAVEMIVAVFESQRLGTPVRFPLANRQNPLVKLGR
jgi:predicted dehydrogenase